MFIEKENPWIGVRLELHSYQRRKFESEMWQQVIQILGIKKTRATSLHTQSDGMVEHHNTTICQYGFIFVEEKKLG